MDEEGLARKRAAVTAAVTRAQSSRQRDLGLEYNAADGCYVAPEAPAASREYARAMLAEVGGLEIAAMAGAIMHAKEVRVWSAERRFFAC